MTYLKYISDIRPKLKSVETNTLIITKTDTYETDERLNYLIGSQQYLFPYYRLNAKTIHLSVIANLLKRGNDLRLVQVFE